MVVALPSGHPLAPSADKAVLLQSLAGEGALKRIEPRMQPNEWGLLNAFDSHRDLICAAPAKAYRRGRKGSCESTPADFDGASLVAAKQPRSSIRTRSDRSLFERQ